MARTSRRQPNSYRGGRVVGNLAYDERYAEPIVSGEEELNENPRARSAKLRVAEKC